MRRALFVFHQGFGEAFAKTAAGYLTSFSMRPLGGVSF